MTIQIGTDTIAADQTVRAAETAALVHAGGFSGNDLVMALAISRAESGWDYKATHKNTDGTTDWGLFQINDVNKPTEAEKTLPLENAKKAYSLFKSRGWQPWATYTSGAYKQYMNAANAAVKELQSRGKAFADNAVKANGGGAVMAPGKLENLGPANPLDGVSKMVQDFGNKLFGFFNLSLGVLLGVALLVVGVVLLSRGFATRVVAGTVKDIAKNASKAPEKPVKVPLSVEDRAARSLDYSAARKRLQDERLRAAAEVSRAKLRKL